jgi:DNA-binding XRE family transcriptional regulator
MPTFAEALKKEIVRLARKELRSDVVQLRKLTTSHRSEIAALKRDVKSLQTENRALTKAVRRIGADNVPPVTGGQEPPHSVRRGRKPVFSAEGFRAMRLKLGITQEQMSQVLEVSSVSVYKWESGQATPRAAQQEKIFALRSVGKRAVAKFLAEKAQSQA